MRLAGWLFSGLVILVWALCQVPVGRTGPHEPATIEWRLTQDGWQRQSDWTHPLDVHPPALHPLVVGSLELLVSLAALVAFSQASGTAASRRG